MTPVKRPGGEPDNIPTMNASGDEKEKEPSRDKAFKSASLYLDRRSRGPALIPTAWSDINLEDVSEATAELSFSSPQRCHARSVTPRKSKASCANNNDSFLSEYNKMRKRSKRIHPPVLAFLHPRDQPMKASQTEHAGSDGSRGPTKAVLDRLSAP
jgi:hypothetical protein